MALGGISPGRITITWDQAKTIWVSFRSVMKHCLNISSVSRKLFHFTSLDKDVVFLKLAYLLYQSWSSMQVPCFNKVRVRRHTGNIPYTWHTKLAVLCLGPRQSYITGYLESCSASQRFTWQKPNGSLHGNFYLPVCVSIPFPGSYR